MACGSQAFIAALRVDPSMSGLPILEMQKYQSVGSVIGNKELGLDRREKGGFHGNFYPFNGYFPRKTPQKRTPKIECCKTSND